MAIHPSGFAAEVCGAHVSVRGEVDVVTAPLLCQALVDAQADSLRPTVVDLSEMTFVDARGLGVLINAAAWARRQGQSIVLRGPNPMTLRLLELTQASDAFCIEAPAVGAAGAA